MEVFASPDEGADSFLPPAPPVFSPLAVIRDTQRRLEQLIPELRPDLLHAHSPSLNGIAALRAGRRFNLPVVYEIRAFWEDAAVDHGSTSEGSLRYKLSHGMETWLLHRVDAITVICQGLYDDLLSRGIPASRVTVIPNAVDVESFPVIGAADDGLKARWVCTPRSRWASLARSMVRGPRYAARRAAQCCWNIRMHGCCWWVAGMELDSGAGAAPWHCRQVIFAGRVPHADVNRYYSVIDLLVYPRKSMRLTNTVTTAQAARSDGAGQNAGRL